jgi:hypothetical protein
MRDYDENEVVRESQAAFATLNESGKKLPKKGHHVRVCSWRDDVPQ